MFVEEFYIFEEHDPMEAMAAQSAVQLRPRQLDAHAAYKHWIEHIGRRPLIVKATGTGKALVIATMPFRRMLVLAHRDRLCNQLYETIRWARPYLRVGMEKAEYSASQFDDVVVSSIQTLGSRRRKKNEDGEETEEFEITRRLTKWDKNHFDLIVIDEAHHALGAAYLRILQHFNAGTQVGPVLCGFSLGASSRLILRGGQFGAGWVGTMEDGFAALASNSNVETFGGYEYIHPRGVETRGWTGVGFGWKPVRTFIRHSSLVTDLLRVHVGGARLIASADHSLFRVADQGIVHDRTDRLSQGDICLRETGHQWNSGACKEQPYDFLRGASRSRKPCQVVVDFTTTDPSLLRRYLTPKQRYKRIRGPYGPSLPFTTYSALSSDLPTPTRLYREARGSRDIWVVPTMKLSEWAYWLGFWIGDGWVSDGRITFAVESPRRDDFLHRLRTIPGIGWRPRVRQMPGRSVEIQVSNAFIAQMLRDIFGAGVRCHQKRIPSAWITTWPEAARRELLNGLVDSDGNTTYVKRRTVRRRYTTTSHGLSLDVCALLDSLGVPHSVSITAPKRGGTVRGRTINGKRERFDIDWSGNAENGHSIRPEGARLACRYNNTFTAAPVRSVTRIPHSASEYIYDLEVFGHPSFTANGILAHNTATPFRGDGRPLSNLFDDHNGQVAYKYTLEDATNEGWLCDLEYRRIRTGVDISDLNPTEEDLNPTELSNKINVDLRNSTIISAVEKYAEHRRTILVFAADIAHADKLCTQFIERGHNAEIVHYKIPKEEQYAIFKRFESGETRILVNVGIATEGVDVPTTDCLVLARPTRSLVLLSQMLGRGTRNLCPTCQSTHFSVRSTRPFVWFCNSCKTEWGESERKTCLVLDFVDLIGQLDIRSAMELFDAREVDLLGQPIRESLPVLREADSMGITVTPEDTIDQVRERVERLRGVADKTIYVETQAEAVDLFKSVERAAIDQHSIFPWQKLGKEKFLLFGPRGEKIGVWKNDLGEWWIGQAGHGKQRIGIRPKAPWGQVDKAVKRYLREPIAVSKDWSVPGWRIIHSNVKWRNNKPTDKDKADLRRVGVHTVPPGINRGAIKDMINLINYNANAKKIIHRS